MPYSDDVTSSRLWWQLAVFCSSTILINFNLVFCVTVSLCCDSDVRHAAATGVKSRRSKVSLLQVAANIWVRLWGIQHRRPSIGPSAYGAGTHSILMTVGRVSRLVATKAGRDILVCWLLSWEPTGTQALAWAGHYCTCSSVAYTRVVSHAGLGLLSTDDAGAICLWHGGMTAWRLVDSQLTVPYRHISRLTSTGKQQADNGCTISGRPLEASHKLAAWGTPSGGFLLVDLHMEIHLRTMGGWAALHAKQLASKSLELRLLQAPLIRETIPTDATGPYVANMKIKKINFFPKLNFLIRQSRY